MCDQKCGSCKKRETCEKRMKRLAQAAGGKKGKKKHKK